MAKKEKEFDYKQASEGDLNARLQKNQQELFKLRFRASSAPVKNVMQIRTLRRDIARIYTFMKQRTAEPKSAPVAVATASKSKTGRKKS